MSVEGPRLEPTTANAYNQILANTQQRHRLLSAHWELTYRCNEKCTHCYLDVLAPYAPAPDELSTDECFRIIDELAALGVLNLTVSGGEILVRRDFFKIAEYARSKKFLLRLFTNGILIKPAVADQIAALHPYAVELSLYSTQPEVHDRITQLKHSWELTTRAFRLLRERGIRTVMKTPLMKENVREIHALEDFARELGAQFHYDVTITPKDSGGVAPLQHRMSDEDLRWLFHETIDPSLWVDRNVPQSAGTCGITLNSLALDPYGNVFPCLQTRFNAGNVRNESLRTIWEKSAVWQELSHLTLGELPVCRTCELRNLCVRCHGLALAEDGDLRAPALVNCREALARRQVLIEKGDLPRDFPIPPHLESYVAQSANASLTQTLPTNFVPLASLTPRHSRRSLTLVGS